MIVKNEAKVILRCLASVKQLIDYWVIIDTGSNDGTQDLIREALQSIPGELHERAWVDFSFNRNQALDLAKSKADYVLLIDADERLEYSKHFSMPKLCKDCYSILRRSNETDFHGVLLLNIHLPWRWVGVIHETPECPEMKTIGTISGVVNICTQDGSRSQDPDKFLKDIDLLENAVSKEPQNSRNIFYLAETYSIAGQYTKAIEMYEQRLKLGSPQQEVFWSAYQIGRLQEELKLSPEVFIRSYSLAHQIRSSRVEPLFYLVNHYLRTQTYYLAYLVSKDALPIPLPKDAHFVEPWMYEWGILFQFAKSAWQLGRKQEATAAYKKLLKIPTLPAHYKEEISVHHF